jgi:hypothetical protein
MRVPIATSLCPERIGATSGRKLSRFVERSTSMYETTPAALASHAVRSARPRPFRSIRSAETSGCCFDRYAAICGVESVLALSATTMVKRNGNSSCR